MTNLFVNTKRLLEVPERSKDLKLPSTGARTLTMLKVPEIDLLR
jgi:hypothetical protein